MPDRTRLPSTTETNARKQSAYAASVSTLRACVTFITCASTYQQPTPGPSCICLCPTNGAPLPPLPARSELKSPFIKRRTCRQRAIDISSQHTQDVKMLVASALRSRMRCSKRVRGAPDRPETDSARAKGEGGEDRGACSLQADAAVREGERAAARGEV
ncbi:uncharacterized protein BDZ99DRAFT_480486 [Mytilinidion resinicola]|uniref:Uncharacterized protein n=1 Tax=Mytilinidion resinicola TaxID=574789 RepID=A0A6A6Y8A2_9PEZI|nr:uncharacterized protein BDZ99DRAFT_480486 [Mytilinidion resinicola]KAF2805066.1 hypothetical protein BDZ99DRAFT_480486 [Mytilinidion resinicola]